MIFSITFNISRAKLIIKGLPTAVIPPIEKVINPGLGGCTNVSDVGFFTPQFDLCLEGISIATLATT